MRHRWSVVILLFVVQLGLIFWLGSYTMPRPFAPSTPVNVRIAGPAATSVLAAKDPSLFALPTPNEYSRRSWLKSRERLFQPFAWSEAPAWLTNGPTPSGAFQSFLRSNRLDAVQIVSIPEPDLTPDQLPPPLQVRTSSTFRLTGELGSRPLLSTPSLPSPKSADLLTNTVVRLVVDGDGRPISVARLASSGSAEADAAAVREGWAARFAPRNPGGAGAAMPPLSHLAWGEMVFEWQTVPLPTTNSPNREGP